MLSFTDKLNLLNMIILMNGMNMYIKQIEIIHNITITILAKYQSNYKWC